MPAASEASDEETCFRLDVTWINWALACLELGYLWHVTRRLIDKHGCHKHVMGGARDHVTHVTMSNGLVPTYTTLVTSSDG